MVDGATAVEAVESEQIEVGRVRRAAAARARRATRRSIERRTGDLPDKPTPEPSSRVRPPHALGAFIAAYVALFSYYLIIRERRFATYDYDLGIFDQAVWLLSRGESFITLRGLDFWGHHFEPAMLLFVPAYWLGAGANTLNVAMVIALALGAVPIYRMAKPHLDNDWLAAVIGAAFLVHYSSQWLLQETFHPEVMAITPMLFAWLAASEQRWRAFAGWVIFAVAWKEDVAMAAAIMGLIVAWRGHRRVGLITFFGCAAYFALATEVLLPAMNGGEVFYGGLYGELGNSPADVALRAVTDPDDVASVLYRRHTLGDARDLLAPFGFVSFLSPAPLLTAIPQFLASHLTINGFSTGNRIHYVAMPLVAASVSMVEGLGQVRRSLRPWLVGLIAAMSLSFSAAWGVTQFSAEYETAVWWQGDNPRQGLMEQAVGMVPDGDSISATYAFAPQLAHRSEAYGFPNPWRSTNWAVDPHRLPDPSTIDWLVIDRRHLGEESLRHLDIILDSEDWVIEMNTEDIVVAHRPGIEPAG